METRLRHLAWAVNQLVIAMKGERDAVLELYGAVLREFADGTKTEHELKFETSAGTQVIRLERNMFGMIIMTMPEPPHYKKKTKEDDE